MVLRRVFYGREGENNNEAEKKKTFEVQEVELEEEDLEANDPEANDPEEEKTEKEYIEDKNAEERYIEEDQGDKTKSGPEDPRPLGAWNCFGRRSGPCRCGGLCGICDICDEDEDGGDGAAAGDGANVITAQPPPQHILQNPMAAVPAPVPVPQTTTPGPVRPGSAPTGSAPVPPTTAPAPPGPAPAPPTAVAQATPGPAGTSNRKRKSRAPSPDQPPAQRQRTPSPPKANANVPAGGTEQTSEAPTLTRAQQKARERRKKGHHTGGRRPGRSAASEFFEGKPDSDEEELLGQQKKKKAGERKAWDSSKTEVTATSGSGTGMSASEIAAISLEAPNHPDLTELGLAYRKRGAELQAWIADPTAPGCNAQQKIHKWETLLGNDMKKWDPNTAHTTNLELMYDSLPIQRGWAGPPLEVGNVHKIGLSHNNVYRQIVWQPSGLDANGEQVMNTWRQDTGLGAIFARDILRRFGAYWGEVCQAQYTIDNPIETLKYVFVINCVNEETWPYVMDLYYRKNLSYDDPLFPAVVWQWDSPEYQEILGTTIGRGVARLVLGSFPRGTRRIHRILTWTHNAQLQLQFEIVEVNPTSAAV